MTREALNYTQTDLSVLHNISKQAKTSEDRLCTGQKPLTKKQIQGNVCKELRGQNLYTHNKYHLNRFKRIQNDALEFKTTYYSVLGFPARRNRSGHSVI